MLYSTLTFDITNFIYKRKKSTDVHSPTVMEIITFDNTYLMSVQETLIIILNLYDSFIVYCVIMLYIYFTYSM